LENLPGVGIEVVIVSGGVPLDVDEVGVGDLLELVFGMRRVAVSR
jgi:hypothetical protein